MHLQAFRLTFLKVVLFIYLFSHLNLKQKFIWLAFHTFSNTSSFLMLLRETFACRTRKSWPVSYIQYIIRFSEYVLVAIVVHFQTVSMKFEDVMPCNQFNSSLLTYKSWLISNMYSTCWKAFSHCTLYSFYKTFMKYSLVESREKVHAYHPINYNRNAVFLWSVLQCFLRARVCKSFEAKFWTTIHATNNAVAIKYFNLGRKFEMSQYSQYLLN